MDEKNFSDIQKKIWLDRVLPAWVYPYARLARWDRPVGVWLLFLPCLWGMFFVARVDVVDSFDLLKYAVLFLIGSVTMRGVGCTINDLFDRDFDKQVERTKNRPLASGQLSSKQALGFLSLQLFIGALVLFQFNGTTIFIGLASLPLIVLYPLMKRWTWWPQAFLGITFNWGILMGASSIAGGIYRSILWMYAGAILWTIAYDTIYAFQDIEDDAMVGVKSTARLFKSKTKPILTGFYAMMGLCFLMADSEAIIFSVGTVVIVLAHIVNLWKFWDMGSQPSSLSAFKRHIGFGWGILGLIIVRFLLTV